MYLKFLNVEISKFQSINRISINLDSQGVVLIKGVNEYEDMALSNGSGKSSISEAICWCLYGETAGGVKNPSNRHLDGGCEVSVTFEVDSKDYRILRYIKKGAIFVELFENDVDVSCRNRTDTDKHILSSIVKIPVDVFLSTIYLSQGFSNRLSELSPTDRKERLEVLTGTSNKIDKFKDKFLKFKSNISEKYDTKNNEISFKCGVLDTTKKQLSLLESEMLEVKADETVQQESSLKEKIKKLKSSLEKIENDISNLNTDKNKCFEVLTNIKCEKSNIVKIITDLENKIKNTDLSPTCKECGQKLNLIESEALVKKYKCDLNSYDREFCDVDKKESKAQTDYDSLSKNLKVLLDKKCKIVKVIKELEITLSSIKVSVNLGEVESKIIKTKTTIDDIKGSVSILNEELLALEVKKEITSNCVNLITKPFRNFLLESIVTFMNEKLKHYSSILFSNKCDAVVLDLDSSKLNIFLGNSPYQTLSGGEKRKVDLALVLAQRDLLLNLSDVSSNIFILDEVFDNLDDEAVSNVVSMFLDISPEITTTFIISHKLTADIPYDYTITARKSKQQLTDIIIN